MRLRYSARAARQVDEILAYLAERSPQGFERVRQRLLDIVASLQIHPSIGQATNRPGVRRVVLTPYPYVIDYEVDGDRITILIVRHGARRRS